MILKFYCSKIKNKKTGEFEYRFKAMKEKEYKIFHSLEETIEHLKSLKLNATMWLRENEVFVSSIKTRIDEDQENVEVEIVHFKNKKEEDITTSVEKEVVEIPTPIYDIPVEVEQPEILTQSNYTITTASFNLDDVQAIKEEIIAKRATREYVIEEGYVSDLDDIDIHHKNLDDTCELCIGDTSTYHLTDTHMHNLNVLDNEEPTDEVIYEYQEEVIESEPTFSVDETEKYEYIEIEPTPEPDFECQDCKLLQNENELLDEFSPCHGCEVANLLPEAEEIIFEPEPEFDPTNDLLYGKYPEYDEFEEQPECPRCNNLWSDDEFSNNLIQQEGMSEWEFKEDYIVESEVDRWTSALGSECNCENNEVCMNLDEEILDLNTQISALEETVPAPIVEEEIQICEECEKDKNDFIKEEEDHLAKLNIHGHQWEEHELWCRECKIINADISLWEYNSRTQKIMDESPEIGHDLCSMDWEIDKDPLSIDVLKDDILDEKEMVVDLSRDDLVVSGKVLTYNQNENIIDDGNYVLWNQVTNEIIPVNVMDITDINARDNLHVRMADEINIINRDCVEVSKEDTEYAVERNENFLVETLWTRTNFALWFILWITIAIFILLFIIFMILFFV
ncbi:hypothetical protein [Mesomycoplasma neurolyticum]|uniref:Uncharacterized protein n=1 Tax=Mesomycoplasma neurolyticum TaxID=2120 RepID=A0A449A4J0_9BACT|nr:hypothetical protein [Mesomycoplasma neurolyticum]VEU59148.1 Uncharacterised protein [Mesomycoplasma neurolyticum]